MPVATKSQLSTAEGDLVEMIDKRVGITDLRQERLVLEQLWLTCMAFWSGKQRFYVDGGKLWEPPPTADQNDDVTYKVNLIRSRSLGAIAKVLGTNAKFRVRPPTGSARDRELAALSEKVFDHVREVGDFEWAQLVSTMWKCITGNSVLKTYWDPNVGEPDRFYWADGASKAVVPTIMLSPEEIAEKDQSLLFEDLPPGDIRFDVLSPFGFFYDTASRDRSMRGVQWVAEKHFADIDRIAERWDVEPADIAPMESNTGLINYEEAIAFMSQGAGWAVPEWVQPRDKQRKRTLYIEYWERPSKAIPKGRRIVYAGGKILNKGKTDNPYVADRTGWAHIPYVLDVWTPHPGRFWGAGLVEDMLNPQFVLNATRTILYRFMDNFGMPDTFVGKNAGIDTDNIPKGGGNVYSVNESSAFGVKNGPIPQMPAEVAGLGNLVEGDLNAVASQSQVDGGKLPGELRSGAAINAVNDDRYITLTVPARSTMRTVRDCGRIALSIGKLYYGPARVLRYLGEANDWVVEEFNGSDLLNDVVIIGQPDVTDTVDAQRQEMMDMVNGNVFDPARPRMMQLQIMSGMHFGTSNEFMQSALQAKRNQEREIREMIATPEKWLPQPGQMSIAHPLAQGQQDPMQAGGGGGGDMGGDEAGGGMQQQQQPQGPQVLAGYPVTEWQDHEIEAQTCVEFMYTPEFAKLAPEVQALIHLHWQQHFQLFAAQQQAQAAQQAAQGEQKGQSGKPAPGRGSEKE